MHVHACACTYTTCMHMHMSGDTCDPLTRGRTWEGVRMGRRVIYVVNKGLLAGGRGESDVRGEQGVTCRA